LIEALRELGYVDGQNIRLDTRFAENRLDLLPALAAELVNGQPDVSSRPGSNWWSISRRPQRSA